MKPASEYTAFNARWLQPEEVARLFVPTLPFKGLVRLQNSLLMGPRGCGKTTLLKMLTRRAQRVWQERLPREPQWIDYRGPDFEAIYIPSDVRWSSELLSISQELSASPVDAERMQRASVAISAVIEATHVVQEILDNAGFDPTEFLKSTITHLQLGPTIPSFREIRLKLVRWMDEIQSALIRRSLGQITHQLDMLPAAFTGHCLSAITKLCTIFDELAPSVAPKRWALCFDELEIAPPWLQIELFAALRSFNQRFLLKLTWSPVLPSDLMPRQERQHDYAAIPMWHAHAADARPFCKDFSTRFLRDRLNNPTVSPRDVFGPSPFAQEELELDQAYRRGGPIWRAMVHLAERDYSFKEYLVQHGISPTDPVAEAVTLRDETLRKIKPIVLVREAYLRDSHYRPLRRSRKNPSIYFGEDAIYAMSEGNPRLLAGLLNELLDIESRPNMGRSPLVRPESQSRVLHAASQRVLMGIKAFPTESGSRGRSLASLVEKLGRYLQDELLTRAFNADPFGSFIVDEAVSSEVLKQLSIGLLIGAFVHVKSPEQDIGTSVLGSKIRLSYMLAPHFRLLLRNQPATRLSTALRISASSQRVLGLLENNSAT
jgi:hypothetical protein